MSFKVLKERYSELTETQQYVLNKALRKVAIELYNYFRFTLENDQIGTIDVYNNNIKYDGYINHINKRVETASGKKYQCVHYAKNISTGKIISFSLADYKNIFSGASNSTRELLINVEHGYNKHLNNIIYKLPRDNEECNKSFIKKILNVAEDIKSVSNYEAIVNLLYYDLPLSDSMIQSLEYINKKVENKKNFEIYLQNNPDYDSMLTLLILSPLDNVLQFKYPELYKKYDSIMKFYNKHNYLTEKQLIALNNLFKLDYDEIEKMFEYLSKNLSRISSRDIKRIADLKYIMNMYGLKEDKVDELAKYYKKYFKEIV